MVSEGQFGYQDINVACLRREPESLLNWMERAIRLRKECPELGWGQWQILDSNHASVFAHRCEWQGNVVIAIHNLSPDPCDVTLTLKDDVDHGLVDLFKNQPGRSHFDPHPRLSTRRLRLPLVEGDCFDRSTP